MTRTYFLLALFGFCSATIVIFAPYLLSVGENFYLPQGGAALSLRYYLLSLAFFVIFTMAATMKTASLHRGRPGRWFGISLAVFSAGAWLAILLFFVLLGWALTRLSPSL